MFTIAMTNQKGGVGKTTVTVNLAAGLARMGYRVGVIDLDPQYHLSKSCDVTASMEDDQSFPHVLINSALHTLEVATTIPVLWQKGVDIVPSNIRMCISERLIYRERAPEIRLKTLCDLWAQTHNWDVCLIDCPPSLAILSDNALVAADQIIIPVEAEDSSLHALELLQTQIDVARRELRIDPEILGLVVNDYDTRRGYEVTSTMEVLESMDIPILATIKNLADLRRAWRAGQSVYDIDPHGAAAAAYTTLAKTLIDQ